MHWLRLFLFGWLSFGIPTVVFLFWLCKRTAVAAGAVASSREKVKLGALSPDRA
jgi:hypothetical protein